MKTDDLLKGISGGSFQLMLKFPDQTMWSARISESMLLRHQAEDFLFMNFGSRWNMYRNDRVEKLQIVAGDDPDKNKVYMLLAPSEINGKRMTATYMRDTFIESSDCICIDRYAGKVIDEDQLKTMGDVLMSGLIIHFASPLLQIKPQVVIALSHTGLSPSVDPSSLHMRIPQAFMNEKIEVMAPESYAQKYHVNVSCARHIQDFAKLMDPKIQDYASLRTDGSDQWSKLNIDRLALPGGKKQLLLSVISRYIDDYDDIACTFRWYMRGLPLLVSMQRTLVLHMYRRQSNVG